MTETMAAPSLANRVFQSFGRFFLGNVFRWLLVAVATGGMLVTFAVLLIVNSLSQDLPSVRSLTEYQPPVTTRVHAGDGKLIAEFASEHRIFVPYEGMPDHLIAAFVSAEDKTFFSHHGVDYMGMVRAALRNVVNKVSGRGGLQGASTITQQVAKNMVLDDNSQELERKVKEAVIAKRMEKVFSKERILELYLNEIYLGGSSYGVASAALNYFNKSLPELSLEEAALLAAMPKAPGKVNPFLRPDAAKDRRDWVLGRMVANNYITRRVADEAKERPLQTRERLKGAEYAAAAYFVEELRRDLGARVGEEVLKANGLSIRSTLDTKLQIAAQDALRAGLETYDRRKGYRGPVTKIELGETQLEALRKVELPGGYGTREAALVLSVDTKAANLLLADGHEIALDPEDVKWSRTYKSPEGMNGLAPGDVIMVGVARENAVPEGARTPNPAGDPVETRAVITGENADETDSPVLEERLTKPVGMAKLGQIPLVEGALLALDPHTGRILAMAGGYSFWKSQFNRATQAKRQPGSSFKPFVYAAAMEMGDARTRRPAYTPASKILDAPFVQCDYTRVKDQCYKPTNYTSGRFYGMSTMRLGLELSRNAMTVRLANDIGMEQVSDFSERIGLYNNLDPYLSMSLGAGEVTVWDMAKSYALLVNGGKKVTPALFDRVQDRDGKTLYKADLRECVDCEAEYEGQMPNLLPDNREQLIDPIIAFQTAYMLQGVIERGTAAGIRRGCPSGQTTDVDVDGLMEICKHVVGGKTGTTNDYIDAWFMGFSPDLVVGIFVGFDEPSTLGNGESGGRVAAPIFGYFMNVALKDYPALPLRVPSGVRFVNIDAKTGELPGPGTGVIIREAFRRGTEPGFYNQFDDREFSIFNDDKSGGNTVDDGSSGTDTEVIANDDFDDGNY